MKIEEKGIAMDYFMKSHEKYHEWGAVAKTNALFGFVTEAFGPAPGSQSVSITRDYSTPAEGSINEKYERKRSMHS